MPEDPSIKIVSQLGISKDRKKASSQCQKFCPLNLYHNGRIVQQRNTENTLRKKCQTSEKMLSKTSLHESIGFDEDSRVTDWMHIPKMVLSGRYCK
ncbi:hypothetical protein MAR_011704 [Mya arenaria]|uniref:Uncharacterized protein n=1 Tax=Mya arenaria TaxID=6604 RepID=A0ABY7FUX9_MYAAR|nr:hypothetical protein MAR_011704 [Mya arenaria]